MSDEPEEPEICRVTMRTSDMTYHHPSEAIDHCDKCGAEVRIYPSGQALIQQHGRANVAVFCNHDIPPRENIGQIATAPGALEEARRLWQQYRRRN